MPMNRRRLFKPNDFNENDRMENGVYKTKEKKSIFNIFNEMLAMVIGYAMLAISIVIIVIGLCFFIYAAKTAGVIIVAIGAILFTYIVLLRVLRKRLKFLANLKSKCRKHGFKYEKKRGVIRGLKLNGEGFDVIVTTPHTRYYIRFFTAYRRKSQITICDKNTVEIKTNINSGRWKFILGLDKIRVKRIEYSYNDTMGGSVLREHKVLLVNPVPHEMFKKNSDGAIIPIGTGERIYDYTIFSGTGFINELQREYEKR